MGKAPARPFLEELPEKKEAKPRILAAPPQKNRKSPSRPPPICPKATPGEWGTIPLYRKKYYQRGKSKKNWGNLKTPFSTRKGTRKGSPPKGKRR